MTKQAVQHQIEKAAQLVSGADMILFVTGAGMGVDSGLPDFRGNKGFWHAYPALERSGIDFTSIASPSAFRQRPEVAWGFYGHRPNLYRQTRLHAGYGILKTWGERTPYSRMAFTTNVDGHFQNAGFDAGLVTECHGSIHHLQCLNTCTTEIWPADGYTPVMDEKNCLLLNEPPRCPIAAGWLGRIFICLVTMTGWNIAPVSNRKGWSIGCVTPNAC